MITISTAIVYRANGRRYLTLNAACSAMARATIRKWCRDQGEEYGDLDPEWYQVRVKRLARLYRARHRRITAHG